jgi:hypothetical protein
MGPTPQQSRMAFVTWFHVVWGIVIFVTTVQIPMESVCGGAKTRCQLMEVGERTFLGSFLPCCCCCQGRCFLMPKGDASITTSINGCLIKKIRAYVRTHNGFFYVSKHLALPKFQKLRAAYYVMRINTYDDDNSSCPSTPAFKCALTPLCSLSRFARCMNTSSVLCLPGATWTQETLLVLVVAQCVDRTKSKTVLGKAKPVASFFSSSSSLAAAGASSLS